MATQKIPNDVVIEGNLSVTGSLPEYSRASLALESGQKYPLHAQNFRIWDAFQTALTTAGSDDLGIGTGTFGTGLPYLSAGDLKAAGATTRRARILFQLPPEYVAGQAVQIVFQAGMLTTVADSSCYVDVEAYESNLNTLITGSDLVGTAQQSINSLTFAAKTFTLTATTLSAGDWLDIRVSIICTDAATATAVTPAIAHAEIALAIRG